MKSWTKYEFLKLAVLVVLLLILFVVLFSRHGKVGEVVTSAEKRTVKIDFVFPNKDGVIGVTESTPANNIRVLLTALVAYEAKYNSLPPSLSSLGPHPTESRIEMHLESTQEQDVSIQLAEFDLHFERCETIRTENSYKFTDRGIRSLLEDAGFEIGRAWKDSRKWYTVTLACL